ncbi:MAG: hypothetical protein ACYDEQ_07625 [Desulfocucumaceae bacterium]
MFIRWKKQGNAKYATLEERHYKDGKVKTKLVAYLGAHPQARLAALVEAGTITHEDHDRLVNKLPEIPKLPPASPEEGKGQEGQGQERQTGLLLKELMADLDKLTERDIMKEFPNMSSHMAHVDGVKYMLKKLEAIRERYRAFLGDERIKESVCAGSAQVLDEHEKDSIHALGVRTPEQDHGKPKHGKPKEKTTRKAKESDSRKTPTRDQVRMVHRYAEAVQKYPDLATYPHRRAVEMAKERDRKLSSSPIPL